MLDHRKILLAKAALFLLIVTAPGLVRAADRPNILWLIAEDFGNHLGCCGTREVFTPHLDHLAAEGVRYSRFYTTAPVCSPSRSAFMTGMYQTTIGCASSPLAPRRRILPAGRGPALDRVDP